MDRAYKALALACLQREEGREGGGGQEVEAMTPLSEYVCVSSRCYGCVCVMYVVCKSTKRISSRACGIV